MSGAVATEHNPARLLAAEALSSGILAVTHAKLKRVFCIRKGKVVFARSNIIEEQFDETLVRDGLFTRRQQEQVKAAEMAGHVSLLGGVDDARLPDLYRAADVFALPTRSLEGFGMATAEALASEHGSRMFAMSNATKNAGEMVDRLTLQYNKARQSSITTEMLEIVSGAEALK